MRKSEEIDQLATALAQAQAEFEAVPKTADNPFFKSRYADLPSVVLAASPILSKHGIAVSHLPDFDGEHDLLTTLVMHRSGQWIEATARLHLVKADPQGQGSATTYMRRYAYSGAVGIVTETDDDGNAASRKPPAGKARRPSEHTVRTPPGAPAADPATGEIADPEAEELATTKAAIGRVLDAMPPDIAGQCKEMLRDTYGAPAKMRLRDARLALKAAHNFHVPPAEHEPPPLLPGEEPFPEEEQ